MECSNILEAALKKGNIGASLFKGSPNEELVVDLQRTLFELGFRKELKWDNYQADGDYGRATAAAVAAFAQKNDTNSDGTKVNSTLAKLILQRHDFLPSMYLLWQIHNSDLRTKKYISKGTRMSITAVQVLLNEQGYGAQLKFAKYGADGLYGKSTRKAVVAYASDRGISSDGDWLSRPLINQMLNDINPYYGRNWTDQAPKNLPNENSPLRLYEGSQFRNKPVQADVLFLPMLEKINEYAKQADVLLHINSSFRTTTNVNGAIVKPATRSNHLAGHAIDFNVIYGNGTLLHSSKAAKYPDVPEPVRKFLKLVIDDPDLRWGGLFRTKDPVHIDDWLNKDLNKWRARYEAMQKAVQLGQ
ncbi:MAG: peptidoglycan-binding protein [Bacteroidota bacterium]